MDHAAQSTHKLDWSQCGVLAQKREANPGMFSTYRTCGSLRCSTDIYSKNVCLVDDWIWNVLSKRIWLWMWTVQAWINCLFVHGFLSYSFSNNHFSLENPMPWRPDSQISRRDLRCWLGIKTRMHFGRPTSQLIFCARIVIACLVAIEFIPPARDYPVASRVWP